MARSAVVLLSGGLDSSTVAAIALSQGYEVHALSFDYGQRHSIELESARRIADHLGVATHSVCKLDTQVFARSSLTHGQSVIKNRSISDIQDGEVPDTYVPARNTVFLSLGLALAETKNIDDLFIGVTAVDYSGYPDCRPEFIEAFQQLANVATTRTLHGNAFTVHAPLIKMNKGEIISEGLRHGLDYGMTHSCYAPEDALPCGGCDSCILRIAGFQSIGLRDPLNYARK